MSISLQNETPIHMIEKQNVKKKKNVKRQQSKSQMKFFVKVLCWGCLFGVIVLSCVAGAMFMHYSTDLPKMASLKDYNPPIITSVYSDDNRKIGEFYTERRVVIPFEKIPKMLINAFVAAEDSRFFTHEGFDLLSITRAFFKNLEAGSIVQGGSTITQQVTKSLLLSSEKSYGRKIREAILAYKIDKQLKKDEILFLYLNQIYLGHGAYGVEAAAENYFEKKVEKLTLAECAMLAGLPQAPSKYSPFYHYEKAQVRQHYVLNRMLEDNYITKEEFDQAANSKIEIKSRKNWYIEEVPCYTEYVRNYVETNYGKKKLYEDGLQIYTSVNIEMQKFGAEEVEKGLKEIDKRQGYRGPIESIQKEQIETYSKKIQAELGKELVKDMIVKGIVVDMTKTDATVKIGNEIGIIPVDDMKWARKPNHRLYSYQKELKSPNEALKIGDVILVKLIEKNKEGTVWMLSLDQTPEVQAALLCIEPDTGYVKAMIGGRDFRESQFNRAIQSRRQPGSAFKPIVYAAALDREASYLLTDNTVDKLIEEAIVPVAIVQKLEQIKNQEFISKKLLVEALDKVIGIEYALQYRDVIFNACEKQDKSFTAASIIIDSPIVFKDTDRSMTWKPKNYEEKFYGPTLLRNALTLSRNVVTIKILQEIGVDYAIEYAKKLGITSPINQDLSIALGSSGVSLLELVRAYAVFDNQGELVEPIFITKILDRNGEILEVHTPKKERVIEKNTAYCMTSLLQSVIKQGTAKQIKDLKRPVAGKTGTTNNLYDALFIGYTPEYATGVWVGFDKERSLGRGETGSKAAAPIWLGFMKRALADKPVSVFPVPEGVVFANVDADTGLLATPESKNTIFECFKEGTVPKESSTKSDAVSDTTVFFKENL